MNVDSVLRKVAIMPLVVMCALGRIATGSAQNGPIPAPVFRDVAADTPAAGAIDRMIAQGIMHPVSPNTFAPDAPDTLGHFVASVQHMFRLEPTTRAPLFTDVSPNSPIFVAVQASAPYLGRQLLCFGCALGTNLVPDQPLSRAQEAMLITQVLKAQNRLQLLDSVATHEVLAGVADANKVSAPAAPYIATAIKTGVLPLTAEGRIEPAMPSTRAAVATSLDTAQRTFKVPEVQPNP
jgi:hypothetical protein